MVDIFAIALSHGLLALAAWRLMSRPDLDAEAVDGGDLTRGPGAGNDKLKVMTDRQ